MLLLKTTTNSHTALKAALHSIFCYKKLQIAILHKQTLSDPLQRPVVCWFYFFHLSLPAIDLICNETVNNSLYQPKTLMVLNGSLAEMPGSPGQRH